MKFKIQNTVRRRTGETKKKKEMFIKGWVERGDRLEEKSIPQISGLTKKKIFSNRQHTTIVLDRNIHGCYRDSSC